MPTDRRRDDDPRVQTPGGGSERNEVGRVGEDFRGVGDDADELLDDQDFSDSDEEGDDEDAL